MFRQELEEFIRRRLRSFRRQEPLRVMSCFPVHVATPCFPVAEKADFGNT